MPPRCPPRALLVVAFVALLGAGCGTDDATGPDPSLTARGSLAVASETLADGRPVPERFTCDGEDATPDIGWSQVPDTATGIVVVVDDPDAPGGTFTHWTVWGLAPDGDLEGGVPPDAVEGINGFGSVGYRGPCPPPGDDAHTYRFRVLAVDTAVQLEAGASPDDLRAAIEGHVVAASTIAATFGR